MEGLGDHLGPGLGQLGQGLELEHSSLQGLGEPQGLCQGHVEPAEPAWLVQGQGLEHVCNQVQGEPQGLFG